MRGEQRWVEAGALDLGLGPEALKARSLLAGRREAPAADRPVATVRP